MTIDEIENLIKQGIKDSEVTMEGDGCSCSTTVISSELKGSHFLRGKRWCLQLSELRLIVVNFMR